MILAVASTVIGGLLIIWVMFMAWVGIRLLDDLRPMTRFSKQKIKNRIPLTRSDYDDYGRKVEREYPAKEISPEDSELAGKVAIALGLVLGCSILATGIFFGLFSLTLSVLTLDASLLK